MVRATRTVRQVHLHPCPSIGGQAFPGRPCPLSIPWRPWVWARPDGDVHEGGGEDHASASAYDGLGRWRLGTSHGRRKNRSAGAAAYVLGLVDRTAARGPACRLCARLAP